MQAANRIRVLFAVTLLGLLAGCGQVPERPTTPAADDSSTRAR